MAITGGDRLVWRELRARGLIPARPAVLEIGRANWYGDVHPRLFGLDRQEFGDGTDEARHGLLDPWGAADWYYEFMLRDPARTAIDLDPLAEGALRHDLNRPLPDDLRGAFDLVINTGTAEHVFDQRQVWESVHDACRPGGLMVHAAPLWGWLDHGFVNYQPTFVADLAAENGYDVVAWYVHEIATGWFASVRSPADVAQYQDRARLHGAMMHFALRRTTGDAFRVPVQGVYSERATNEQLTAWRGNR